jgi:hypothetical protein
MIPKSVQRFSEKHALGLDPRDHAQVCGENSPAQSATPGDNAAGPSGESVE